ncbi:protein phosphatase 2A regulatory B subunit [Wallemia mellicola]|nr:protein phosphatase 2A regulatory B subunit [Wallemia mellicola]
MSLAFAYEGNNFFDGWVYNYSATDNTTQGNVHYLDKPNAELQNLTFINEDGNAIIRVDNFTDGSEDPDFGRNSVKLVSKDSYDIGSLIVFDADHLPYGDSVWGAFWSLNDETKQDDEGEIDIFEGVNSQLTNRVALHTREGCTQANSTDNPFTGQVISTNCDYKANGNQGCSIQSKDENSYGEKFSDNGGGVFAMLWNHDGIQFWFFDRDEVPDSITEGQADPTRDFGEPLGYYSSEGCNMTEYFKTQKLVINITLCGLWAGEEYNKENDTRMCTDLVKDPENYNDAYFSIKSVKVYKMEAQNVGASSEKKIKIDKMLFSIPFIDSNFDCHHHKTMDNWRFAQCFGDKGDVEEVTEADIISTVEFDQTGDYLATGDKGGRVVLFERNQTKKGCEYKFHTEFQSHEPEFDYLKSLEIEEKINRIKWCKSSNNSHFLLSTNDKTIKLWKVFDKSLKVVSENNLSASHPSPPTSLTLPQITSAPHPSITKQLRLPRMSHHDTIVAAVPRKVYANAHAYHINSIAINSDGETYLSADDLRINLWNLGISDQSFNIVDIKPNSMEDLTEVITAADFHPIHCNLFMYSSSKGTIKLADMRDQALCDRHAKLYEEEEDPSNKSFFSEIISSISDVKFSKDGRYILSRDYLTLKIWDLNMDNKPLKTINIHDHLRTKLCELYENDCIFDKFECTFSGDGKQLMTGSYDNYLQIYNSNPDSSDDVVLQADKSAFKAKKIGGKGLAGLNNKDEMNLDNIDFNKKILHASWHPNEDTIAIGATNNLFLFSRLNN